MLEFGYIRLFRSLTSWEWYTDSNTKDVFLHLILTANYEPKKWRGITVERGQRVFSYSKLASELRLPVQPVRTAIKHLVSTGEVTCSGNREYSIVTVKNYDSYQQLTNEPTSVQQANLMNNLLTNENVAKTQHTNQQTSNMQNSQAESQNISLDISEVTHVSTNEQHTINMPSTHDQQQCKKAKESNKAIKITYSEYRDSFLKYCISLPQPEDSEKWSSGRKKRIRDKNMTAEEMSKVFERIEASDFLTGKVKEFRASIDWILKPENWKKIIEGNYDNRGPIKKAEVKTTYDIDEYENSEAFGFGGNRD